MIYNIICVVLRLSAEKSLQQLYRYYYYNTYLRFLQLYFHNFIDFKELFNGYQYFGNGQVCARAGIEK